MVNGQTRFLTVLLAMSIACASCSTGTAVSSDSSETSSVETNAVANEADAATAEEPTSASAHPDYADASVSYLGPEGTYTQEACEAFFGGQGTYLPAEDVTASVKAMLDGETDYAVIPQENAIGGPIAEYLDEVVGHEQVSIVGEVELPIDQNLLVKPGTKLDDIRTVYSHKQGIAQGKEWLSEHLPQAEVVEVSSTAEGARMAAESKEGDCAAIGARAAAQVYGLEVAAEAIQMNDANKTRFYVLSTEAPVAGPDDRMGFIAAGGVEDLAELLTSVEAAGLEVVAVHDRPEKSELGRYAYLVETSGKGRDAFDAVQKERPEFAFRYLGCFPLVSPGESSDSAVS